MKSGTIFGAALFAVTAGMLGCDKAEALCDEACECAGCNEDQRQDCSDLAEKSELEAEQEDCLSQYGDLLDCYEDNFECVNNAATYDGCLGVGLTLIECLGGQTDG